MAASEVPAVGAAPVNRAAPLRVQVAGTLRELIVSGRLERGRHLVESDLAQALGVSRQPVREALQDLARDRWVELRPSFGAFVHTPTAQEVDDVFRVRSALEAEAAARAAARVGAGVVGKADLRDLHRIVQDGASAADRCEEARIVERNSSFHGHVVAMSGNQVLAELAAAIEGRVRWYFATIATARAAHSWSEHAEVVDAIMAGGEEAAATLMRAHCERSRQVLQEMLWPAPRDSTDECLLGARSPRATP